MPKPFELGWHECFLAERLDPAALERSRDKIREAVAYHAAQAATAGEGLDMTQIERHVRFRIGWATLPQDSENILTAYPLLHAYQSNVNANGAVNGLLREYARQFVADKNHGRELRGSVWSRVRAAILQLMDRR